MDTKTCPKCGATKSLTEFHVDNSREDGRTTICAECRVVNTRAYRKTPGGKAKIRERESRPEVRAKAYARSHAWRTSEAGRAWHRNYSANLRKCPIERAKNNLRNRITQTLKNYLPDKEQRGKSADILGVSIAEAVSITGKWEPDTQIDHKIPVTLAETLEEVLALNSIYNLRRIQASENMSKRASLPHPGLLHPKLPPLALFVYTRAALADAAKFLPAP